MARFPIHSLFVVVALFVAACARAQTAAADVRDPLGDFDHEIAALNEPAGIAFLPDGRLVIAEAVPPRIGIYDRSGQLLRSFGSRGRGEKDLLRPAGVFAAEDGTIFVADAANDRVLSFSETGEPRARFGGVDEKSHLSGPTGVAANATCVVVADTENHRIVAFGRKSGACLWSAGKFGREPGEFSFPTDVAIDSSGAVYVIDSENSRVQKFDASGGFVRAWGLWGYHPGLLAGPQGVAVRGDRVYVADAMNHRVQVYSLDGDLLYMWGRHVLLPHEGNGKLHYPTRIAIAPDARTAAVCETFENRVQCFGLRADGKPEPPVAGTTADLGPVAHYGPYIAAAGNRLTLTEPESHSLLVFDTSRSEAIQICRFAGRGSKFGEFLSPLALGVDSSSGLLFAADRGNRRLQMFRYQPEDGEVRMIPNLARFVRAIDYSVLARTGNDADGAMDISPTAVRCDAQGRLFILDARRERVVVLSRDFRREADWSIRVGEPSPHGATDFVLDGPRDRLAVVDALAGRVNVFDVRGGYQKSFGEFGEGSGQFIEPFGIAVNESGEFFVTDSGAHRVSCFSADGKFVREWGSRGLAAGQFFKPRGAVVDSHDRLYVVDWGNHRVQWFARDGTYEGVFGARPYTRPTRQRTTTQESGK